GLGPAGRGSAGSDPPGDQARGYGRIGPSVGDSRGGDGKSVAKGDGARRPLGRVDVRSERRPNRLGQRSAAGRHGGDLLFDKRENGGQRRQPYNSLNAGIGGHRNYDKDLRPPLRLPPH